VHQRLRCAGHGIVDLTCPFGRRFGKVSRRGIDGALGVAAIFRRRSWRQGLSVLPFARFTEPSSTGGKWPGHDDRHEDGPSCKRSPARRNGRPADVRYLVLIRWSL
jgi:hypothetical protein